MLLTCYFIVRHEFANCGLDARRAGQGKRGWRSGQELELLIDE